MATLFKCDKHGCDYTGSEIYRAKVIFERTKEEVDQLWDVAKRKEPLIPRDLVKQKMVGQVELDLCRKCYEELKESYFNHKQ